MKKILIFLALLFATATSYSQAYVTMANYTDTIVGADVHYYYPNLNGLVKMNWNYAIQAYVDHITGSGDSTHISFQASVDGTTWFDLNVWAAGGTYTVTVAVPTQATNQVAYNLYTAKFADTDDSFLWLPTTNLTAKFFRMKVQHYETGTVRIKAYMYLKPL